MNRIILTNARLGKDVDVRYKEDKPIVRFSVATDREFSTEKKTDWFQIVCFGGSAKFAEKYLHKGSKVNIMGRPQPDFYENKDGQKVNTFDVVVDHIEFAQSKKDEEQSAPSETPAEKPKDDEDGFMTVEQDDMDDLPFV